MSHMSDSAKTNDSIRMQACATRQCESFAELTAVILAERFMRVGRPFDALRILRSYLRQHPLTPKISEQLTALSA